MVDTKPRIYTAGAMDWDGDDSMWRESVSADTDAAEFIHPTETYFDHGGDLVNGAVSEDMALINSSDGVVALFSETTQIGTVTEVVHAAATQTPVLALFDWELSRDSPDRSDPTTPNYRVVENVSLRAAAPDYWFLINYLTNDNPDERPTWSPIPPHSIRPWTTEHATVVQVDATATDAITQIIENWIRNGLQGVQATSVPDIGSTGSS